MAIPLADALQQRRCTRHQSSRSQTVNVMVNDQARQVIDFSLAKLFQPAGRDAEANGAPDRGRTIVGTPAPFAGAD
jgi:hypothetical protein